jgi:hypothetical protein
MSADSTRAPAAVPGRRRLAVAVAVGLIAASAITLSSALSDGVAGAQTGQCVEADNRTHVSAGRATRLIFTAWAVGSRDYLGSLSATTALQQASAGVWELVDSCDGPGPTTTAPGPTTTVPGSTTTTTPGGGDRPPLTERYTAIYETDARLDGHTIYRPQNLAAVTEPMPIVAWGNGGCRADGTWFQDTLQPLAAKGVLVIASGEPGGTGSTTSDMLIDAIDFAVAENSRAGSKYQGKIDTDSISLMGQSCGGIEAIDASSDPRVDSTILWNSGIFPSGGIGGVGKEALQQLHGPVAWLHGGPSDIAYENAVDDYERVPADIPAVLGGYDDVGHFGLFGGTPEAQEAVNDAAAWWLDATLYDNAQARSQFVGPNCGLCSGTPWDIQSKNW